MEFTKAEKRLLDISLAQDKRGQRVLLIGGIVLAVIGIGLWAYSYFRIIPAIEAQFKELEASISSIQVQTKWETTLKQMLLKSTGQIAKDQKTLVETKSLYVGVYLFLCGIICIVTYYKNKTYHSLIRKIKTSQSTPD